MSEKEKRILDTFGKVLPNLSDKEKDRLLYFGEGMAFKTDQQKGDKKDERTDSDSGNRITG